MLNGLLSMVRRYEMLTPGDRVYCAVSGGADSVAMLFAFYLLKEKLDIRLCAAHFNHGLRGEESDRDEAFVRSLCGRLEIPLEVGHGQVQAGKKGLEAAAREARYGFFDSLDGKIATAHTADDNAETVLMHLVRGTGLKGLGAIAPVRGNYIRPLLMVTRQDVLDFLNAYNLRYVVDSSNETDAFLRNRLRHRVMPLLKAENPRLAENLSAMALRLREDEAALSGQWDFSRGLDIDVLHQQPEAVQKRMIAAFLEHCGVREPEAEHMELTRRLTRASSPSAGADFPGNVRIVRCYDRLVKAEREAALPETLLTCPGCTELPEAGFRILCEPAGITENTADTFTVRPKGTVTVRSRKSGDTIRLSGGRKSLKKLFIDRKIPAQARALLPVVADENGVLGVYGIGVNLDAAATELPAIRVRIEKIPEKK